MTAEEWCYQRVIHICSHYYVGLSTLSSQHTKTSKTASYNYFNYYSYYFSCYLSKPLAGITDSMIFLGNIDENIF